MTSRILSFRSDYEGWKRLQFIEGLTRLKFVLEVTMRDGNKHLDVGILSLD